MTANNTCVKLCGRQAQCQALSERIDRTRRRCGGGLVIRGEAGTGKTTLLEFAAGIAPDMRVIRLAGAPAERRVGYAGLQQFCAALTKQLDQLPPPQRDAIDVGLGVRRGPVPGRLLLGSAVLALLTAAARETPVLCVVDDAHCLDRQSAQALVFAARRIESEAVLLIFAARPTGTQLLGLPELTIGGLSDHDARELLPAAVRYSLDERVRDLIIAETRGNPGALTDLPRTLSMSDLAGGFQLAAAAEGEVSDSLRRKMNTLPAPARLLVITAAADPTGDPGLLSRAADHLGISPDAASPVVESGLLAIGRRVVFRDPAVRAAAYRSASGPDRRAAHRALAQATVLPADEDRRAWHAAQAASRADERIAAELERTAARAELRGGFPASAAFLDQAARLTPEPSRRSRRALAAAERTVATGAAEATGKLLDLLEPDLDGSGERQARADVLRALTQARARIGDVPQQLLDAARRLDGLDAAQADAASRDALVTAMAAAGLAVPGSAVRDVAPTVRRVSRSDPASTPTALLDGVAAYLTGDYPEGIASVRAALPEFGHDLNPIDELRWLPLACHAALLSWDERAWETLARRRVRLAREFGAFGDLPGAVSTLACSVLVTGDVAMAGCLSEEARAVADVVGLPSLPSGAVALAVLRTGPHPAAALISRAVDDAAARGQGLVAAAATWAEAVLHNAWGRYQAAFAAAERAVAYAGPPALAGWAMAELIEAAGRTGQRGRVAQTVRDLAQTTGAAGTDWALGVQSRSLALVSDRAEAEAHHRQSIAYLSRSRARLDLARAHLLYGEWLRREQRRVDAREHLRRAYEMLAAMGADGFADRARRELLATGQNLRKQVPEASSELTAQELQIAARARDGHTNAAIGNELFLSPRTVEWHLRKVFTKLGITSRRQLAGRVLRVPPPGAIPPDFDERAC